VNSEIENFLIYSAIGKIPSNVTGSIIS